ncbi:hypothetical protein [Streptomyces sp. NPDC058457]|uniref:hypothetical protein n=1 Tax=Streptomyces sp. NPDC058457 TaxID=3346507 RepID=UPI003665F32B
MENVATAHSRTVTVKGGVSSQAEKGLGLPEIDGRAVRGLKFAEAPPARLAEATPAARTVDEAGARLHRRSGEAAGLDHTVPRTGGRALTISWPESRRVATVEP